MGKVEPISRRSAGLIEASIQPSIESYFNESLLVAPLSALVPQGFTVRQPKCIYLVDPGPCKEWVKVWGFDYLTNRCIFYYYGGCGGNPNRFYTKAECLETCRVYDDPNRKRRKDSDDSEDMFESDIDDWDHFEL